LSELPSVNTPISDPNLGRKKRTRLRSNIVFAFVSMWATGCALFTPQNLPKTILSLEQIACIVENAFIDDAQLNAVCGLLTADQQAAARNVQRAARVGATRRAMATQDAGVEGGK
jgi:hypothetical protein